MLFCWDAVVETTKVLDAVEYILFFFYYLHCKTASKGGPIFPILAVHKEKNVDF